jgi:hypothetical protein
MALVIKGSSSGQITLDVPSAAGTNTITLPAETGNILTDGSALPAIDGSALTGLAGGTIVKVAADEITAVSDGSGAFQNIGLEVSITPASTANKILLLTTGSVATLGTGFAMKFTQDGTDVGIGDTPSSNTARPRVSFKGMSSNGNRSANFSGSCILSPSSTSSLTYRVQIEAESQGTWRLNQSWHFSNSTDVSHAVTASYLYAIELDGSNTTIST